jgi:ADP-ribosylglycohydrolase
MPDSHEIRLRRARISLEGLSVGDAFGECYFGRRDIGGENLRNRRLQDAPWNWTDDTNMAISIYDNLSKHREIVQDDLAQSFAHHYHRSRGYGAGAHRLIEQIKSGDDWREASKKMFGGAGSFGNGAAMRITPLGAYFADDMDALIENARRSAEVTHAHPEGIAGAIAVAAAASLAWQFRDKSAPSRYEFVDYIFQHVPKSEVRSRIRRARDLESTQVIHAANILGNGSEISAQDTVPFVLWCAGENLSDFEGAMWNTVSGLGDRDTTCAMVGGIVVMWTGLEAVPGEWIKRREPLPEWAVGSA